MTNFEFKVQSVKDLKQQYKHLKKLCEKNLREIDKEGISRHYSIDADVFETATKIYKISLILGFLNTFNLQFLDKEIK